MNLSKHRSVFRGHQQAKSWTMRKGTVSIRRRSHADRLMAKYGQALKTKHGQVVLPNPVMRDDLKVQPAIDQ
jgi:hypothetical protein